MCCVFGVFKLIIEENYQAQKLGILNINQLKLDLGI